MTQTDNQEPLKDEEEAEAKAEQHTVPPIAQKVSRFGPQTGSRFGKGATNFNPPNKQRPGRAAGRGR